MAQALFKSWFVDFHPVKAKIAALEAGGSEEDALLAAMQAIPGSALFDADASAASAEERLSRLQAEQPEQYPELRATAELFPSAMQDSELGEIPEGWDVQQIGEILDRLKPKKRYTKKQVVPTGQTPVFEQGSDILLGFHNDSPGFIATSEDPAFIFGDHTCIIHLSCQNFDVSQNVIPLKGKSRSTMWTYYALQGKQTFQEYRRHWAELVVKPVIYPPNALCKQFSEAINSSIRLKEQLDQEAKRLSEIRDLLLPKLLSGQLSVSGTANCVPEVEEVTDV
jgi:type I restriction enzyme S subunit